MDIQGVLSKIKEASEKIPNPSDEAPPVGKMNFNSHEQLSEYIFTQYMTFGKYTIQDKYMVETFDFGITTLSDFEKLAALIYEAVSNPHPNLDPYDYEFAAKAAIQPVYTIVRKFSDEEYEAWLESIKKATGGNEDDNLFMALTEF